MRDLIANFASTTLAAGIGATDTTFTVATGGGALFPQSSVTDTGPLLVVIDSEIILCAAPSGDVFTVLARGYESTTAVGHSTSATVQQVFTAGMLNHLWANLPDRFHPDVAPLALGITPSGYDDEFEGNSGLWTVYPQDAGLTFDYGVTSFSYLVGTRATSTTTYLLTQPYAPASGGFTITAHLQQGCVPTTGGSVWLFVSDTPNLHTLVIGNTMALGLVTDATQSVSLSAGGVQTNLLPTLLKAQVVINGGIDTTQAATVWDCGYKYLRLQCTDGLQSWVLGASVDGVTYTTLLQPTCLMTPAVLGFCAMSPGGAQTLVSDWVRTTQP